MAKTYYYLRFPQGKPKCITLSYDDGVDQDIRLIALMEQYGFKGTFNLNYGKIAPEGVTYEPGRYHRPMPLSLCKKTYASPNAEVAVHGLTHPWLERLTAPEVMTEIVEDRKGLEKEFGGVIRGMAYPYGTHSDLVVDVLKLCGIAYARTTKSTERFDLPKDWLRLPATCHHANPKLMDLAEQFDALTVKKDPALFYLWGHTYEFERDDNWEIIEDFFRLLTGKADVWYATNIELYDYIKAYEALVYSADGKRVYNPAATDVWLGNEQSAVCIPAGKTVDLQ